MALLQDPAAWPAAIGEVLASAWAWITALEGDPAAAGFLALPFLLPLLLALLARSLAAGLGVAVLGALGTLAVVAPKAMPEAWRGYLDGLATVPFSIVEWAAAFAASLCIAWGARMKRRQILRLASSGDALRAELAEANDQLLRERFWRHAAGDQRSVLPSEELLDLARRVQAPLVGRTEPASEPTPLGQIAVPR